MMMEHLLSSSLLLVTTLTITLASSSPSPCETTCGSLEIKYPFGTGHGCGSPRFEAYVSCSGSQVLLLSTHSGDYPITSISYPTSTLTLTPPSMSTCTNMIKSPTNLGLDWASPFQLGPSTLILLACATPSLPACDPSSDHLCASLHTCPAVVTLGLPPFPPTNTCCVYSPANLNANDQLDLHALRCAGYASVVSVNDYPTDPTRWEYGMAVKYTLGAFDEYDVGVKCRACEVSGGACGYKVGDYSFLCVCGGGFNTTLDCYGTNYNQYFMEDESLSSPLLPPTYGKLWSAILVGIMVLCCSA